MLAVRDFIQTQKNEMPAGKDYSKLRIYMSHFQEAIEMVRRGNHTDGWKKARALA